jgi:hypothetical protein
MSLRIAASSTHVTLPGSTHDQINLLVLEAVVGSTMWGGATIASAFFSSYRYRLPRRKADFSRVLVRKAVVEVVGD